MKNTELQREKKEDKVKPKKRKVKYPPPEDGSMVVKDSCPKFNKVAYPESKGGEMMIKRDLDTHRVQLKQVRNVPDIKLTFPEDVVRFVREMEDYDRERFKVIFLDNKNRVLGVENISEGTINAAIIHPREAVKGAVLANASGVILIHNHPSGIPEPSNEDNLIVPRLCEGFKLMSIDVIDAIIIAKEGYYSYKEYDRIPGNQKANFMETKEDNTKNDKCSIAMQAAMSTIKDYCGEDTKVNLREERVKYSSCYILLFSSAITIWKEYLSGVEEPFGHRMNHLESLHTKNSKIEDNILSCEGNVNFGYLGGLKKETGDIPFQNKLDEILKTIHTDDLITRLNYDDDIQGYKLEVIEFTVNGINYTPDPHRKGNGCVDVSISIKARQGA